MNIKAILFDVNGTLIDIQTDEGAEEIYRGISHFLTYQGIYVHRWEVRDEYYRLMDEQRRASGEAFPEFDAVELWREFLRRRPEACQCLASGRNCGGCPSFWRRCTGAFRSPLAALSRGEERAG